MNIPIMNGGQWEEVPGFNGYLVNQHGDVYTNKRNRLLIPDVDKDGYLCVRLKDCGRTKKWLVHRLVYSVFNGELIDGLCVCHKDNTRDVNAYDNLEQKTQMENIHDKRKHETWQAGEKHPLSKLTNQQAKDIRQKHSAGHVTMTILSEEYGVSLTTISKIIKGELYIYYTPCIPDTKNYAIKLTDDDVLNIRADVLINNMKRKVAAEKYNICVQYVSDIVTGRQKENSPWPKF